MVNLKPLPPLSHTGLLALRYNAKFTNRTSLATALGSIAAIAVNRLIATRGPALTAVDEIRTDLVHS